ncbi:flagellar biosynthesis protein FlhA [Sporanaerobium hydrogeniformans]|uniref:Flagellar biosynthesis protein FlhA n=1 Tax=Sporanaerobium hydrogeniformans TaxID=3072179 RepID=A0AC61DEK8_9FIRM|nr:flagellar biosynthesis protein FlhA [Sporanaerobium hydrogeniformans]PHV71759.1 flagellar biosynthesis protein FlhA [Sporanaerobium hydrogeniformans]
MKFKSGDILLGIFVIGVIFLVIIPLPDFILSLLMIINISIAAMILLSALFSKESLDLSLFPTMLLLTTLFRLGLNISSTRLILQNGYAGEVVQAFGEFVAGGDIVIGAVIFIIITIVNFKVITKGSERVAEVTARFTLDAMPGKQMAIDADLNTGFIDETQAKERRKKIQDEAAFFGAMDGASKFVKNDAVVGLFITGVNIVGGLIIGMVMKDMAFMDALQKYTIVTIGDGLVSSIPALFISTGTGILVTKTNTDDGMSSIILKQLVYSPIVLYVVGITLVALGLFTPMGPLVTFPIAIVWFVIAFRFSNKKKVSAIESAIDEKDEQAEEIRKPENVISLLQVDPIELEFGYGIIPLADVNQGGDLLDRVVMIRRQIALELGSIVPIVRLRDNIQLAPNAYSIKIKGVEVAKGEILFDHYMAMNPGYVEEEIDGIQTMEPAFGLPALWITEMQREKAEIKGYTVVDCPSIIATHLTEVIKAHLHELLSRQDVKTLINHVNETHSTLIEELTPKLLSVGDIQKVLSNLLKEGISIRDLVTICEILADYAPTIRDTDVLTEYVRQGLSRAISKKIFMEGTNQVITLDPAVEQQIMEHVQHTEQGAYVALDPKTIQSIVMQLKKEIAKLTTIGLQPIILTSPIVRIYFKQLTEQYIPDLIVISYNEIEQSVEIQSIGMVSIA